MPNGRRRKRNGPKMIFECINFTVKRSTHVVLVRLLAQWSVENLFLTKSIHGTFIHISRFVVERAYTKVLSSNQNLLIEEEKCDRFCLRTHTNRKTKKYLARDPYWRERKIDSICLLYFILLRLDLDVWRKVSCGPSLFVAIDDSDDIDVCRRSHSLLFFRSVCFFLFPLLSLSCFVSLKRTIDLDVNGHYIHQLNGAFWISMLCHRAATDYKIKWLRL